MSFCAFVPLRVCVCVRALWRCRITWHLDVQRRLETRESKESRRNAESGTKRPSTDDCGRDDLPQLSDLFRGSFP